MYAEAPRDKANIGPHAAKVRIYTTRNQRYDGNAGLRGTDGPIVTLIF